MYRNIEAEFWDDPRVRGLTVEAKLVFLHLVTSRHTHFSGLYSVRLEYVALETGLSTKQVQTATASLEACGLIAYDDKTSVVWVVRMLRHQARSPKLLQGAASHVVRMHGSTLIRRFLDEYPAVKAHCVAEDLPAEGAVRNEAEGGGGRHGADTVSIPYPASQEGVSILPVSVPDPDPVSGEGESEGKGAPTQEDVAKALRLRLGSSINPCRDQVRALVAAGWSLQAIRVAVERHGEPGLAPWDWTKRARGTSERPAHRGTPNVSEILAAGQRSPEQELFTEAQLPEEAS